MHLKRGGGWPKNWEKHDKSYKFEYNIIISMYKKNRTIRNLYQEHTTMFITRNKKKMDISTKH